MVSVYLFANKFFIVVMLFIVNLIKELSDVNLNELVAQFFLGNSQLVWQFLNAFDLVCEVCFVEN